MDAIAQYSHQRTQFSNKELNEAKLMNECYSTLHDFINILIYFDTLITIRKAYLKYIF